MNTPIVPTFTLEHITPAVAREYLAHNTWNRRPKKAKINRYARDMREQHWLVTAETIKFAPDGRLIDGQNRLMAISLANVTVPIHVARDVSTDAMRVLDSGTPRSTADALNLSGLDNGKDLAAVANVHAAWRSGGLPHAMSTVPNEMRLTNSEAHDYLGEHPSVVEATRFATNARTGIRLPVGAIAVAYTEFMRLDPELGIKFFEDLRDFRGGGAGDPMSTLLRRLERGHNTQRRMFPATGIYFLARTWNALRADESLHRLYIGSEESGWTPLPDFR